MRQGGRAEPAPVPGWLEMASILAITLLAVILRAPGVGSIPPGLWVDEAVEGLQAQAFLSGEGLPKLPDPDLVYPRWPVWWLLEIAAVRLGGMTMEAVRAPAVVVGTLAVPLAWLAVRSLWGGLAGLAAAAFLATSFFHIQYSRLGVAPILLVSECLVAGWVVLAPAPRRPAVSGLVLGAVCAAACLDYAAGLALPVWVGLTLAARFVLGKTDDRALAKWGMGGLAAGTVLLYFLARMFISARMGRVSAVGFAAPLDMLAQAGFTLANFSAPVAGAHTCWDNFPPGAPRFSPVENFALLAGLAAASAASGMAGWRRLALLAWIPVLLLPEILPGTAEGIYLVRGLGALAAAAFLAGLGSRVWGPVAGKAGAAVILVVTGLAAVHSSRIVFGPFANSELARRMYFGVASEVAGGIRELARGGPVRVYPPLAYADHPQIAFHLWNEAREGAVLPAGSPPVPERSLAVYRDPVGRYPIVALVVSRGWPRDRTIGLWDVQGRMLEGQSAERAGRLGEAEEAYRLNARLVTDYWQAHAALGILLRKQGRRGEARKYLEEAVRLGAPGEIRGILEELGR